MKFDVDKYEGGGKPILFSNIKRWVDCFPQQQKLWPVRDNGTKTIHACYQYAI